MLTGISKLGIKSIELGYNFTASRLNKIASLLADFNINVISVHNFCPLPPQNIFHRFFTNYYFLSSLTENERECAVKYTKQTINTAENLNAKIVVIHAGTIEMDTEYIKALINLYNLGKIHSEEANSLREKILQLREEKKEPYLRATLKSLDEITEYALKKGIKIGLENRYYPNEIPNNEEAAFFLKELNSKGLVYWHDVGHAQAQERLSIIKKDSLLDSLNGYLFGFHLHGINGLKDHISPLSGDFDFSQISTYLTRANLLKVIEAHQPASSDELKETLRYFASCGWL
ncbi:MAG: TIM barrel protein [Candidatus Omnitrophota bacterium]